MEQKPTLWQAGFKAGLITALVIIIYSLILQLAGLAANQQLNWVSYLIIIGGIVWAHKLYKESGDGYMGYGQGLGIGSIVSVVAGVVSMIFSYVYIKFIDDSLLGQVMEQTRRELESKGMDDEQIDQTLAMSEKFMTPEMILIFGILGFVILGFIFSLIISAFTKKNNPELEY